MAFIPTPTAAVYSKASAGTSDVTSSNNVYKFMGCSLLSVSATIGFNGTSSSLNVSLVEDTQSGDSFVVPTMPSVYGFSLPSGGVGQPIFVSNSFSFNPNAFEPTNVPFYFGGVCTGFSKTERDTSGKLINVNFVDPRELLGGVQCLLGGFALSQNVTGSLPRYAEVQNVIDVFGYYDYGMTADKNEYGMTWEDIKTAIEAVQVEVNNLKFEFLFTGECFTDTPDWYRIDDSIIDVVSLAQIVAKDGGSDLVCIGRKVASNAIVVEFRGIRRENTDLLTESELQNFVSERNDIVDSFRKGREYRNEPTSAVIIGGMRNSNYTAYPTSYNQNMHLRLNTATGSKPILQEDYNSFPEDIKVRLFGGDANVLLESQNGSGLGLTTQTFSVNTGAIFPFWGFSPSGTQYPLVEPFLSLDHLVFDWEDNEAFNAKGRIPLCKIGVQTYTVREVTHADVFLDGDGDSDSRPFAYIEDIQPGGADIPGYVRGLPLNTEVLRAALIDKKMFFELYSLYYPDQAEDLRFPTMNFKPLLDQVTKEYVGNSKLDPFVKIAFSYQTSIAQANAVNEINRNGIGGILKADGGLALRANFEDSLIYPFHDLIYDKVKEYADEHVGAKFLVCLPKSTIMNRIWSGLPVPTRPDFPEIEYTVADRGYWETLPFELDGIFEGGGQSSFSLDEENQILRRFMAEDGRFYPMAGIDWKPSGNCSFNSNGLNKAMFQDLPVSDFRPNKIAEGNPTYVLAAIKVDQLQKRPDLALVNLPPIEFDTQREPHFHHGYIYSSGTYQDEILYSKIGIIKYLWYFYKRNYDLRSAIEIMATRDGNVNTMARKASEFISLAAEHLKNNYTNYMGRDLNRERVMDLKGVVIPLTSNWVAYGPWYATSGISRGMVDIQVENTLVPWNFERPTVGNWDDNLNTAGNEALTRTISNTDYIDSAVITTAGFPEFGLAKAFGKNSNLTSIAIDFGIGGVKTTYNFSTYDKKPGTFRKSEYDNVDRARIDTRPDIVEPENISINDEIYSFGRIGRRNKFDR